MGALVVIATITLLGNPADRPEAGPIATATAPMTQHVFVGDPVAVAGGTAEVGRASADAEESAIATFERFVNMVDRGRSRDVLEMLVPHQPLSLDGGKSSWPYLPTDAGWWFRDAEGLNIDASRVAGFVRYVFTVPGSVFLQGCSGVLEESGDDVLVSCRYTASGGVFGDRLERGVISARIDGRGISSVETVDGAGSDARWQGFAAWVAAFHPEQFVETLGTLVAGEPQLDPTYSGDTALMHADLARRYLEVGGVQDHGSTR